MGGWWASPGSAEGLLMFPTCISNIVGHSLNLGKQWGQIELLGRWEKKGSKYQKLGEAANNNRNVASKV